MADNTRIDNGTTGDTIRTEDRAGVKTPVSILDIGGAGAETLLSAANPMPVSDNGDSLTVDGPLTDAELRATAVPISATMGISGGGYDIEVSTLPLPAGAATSATQSAMATILSSIAGKLPAALTGGGNLEVAIAESGAAVIAAPQTGAIYSGTTALTPKYASISTATSGNTTAVAAVAGKKLRVLSYRFQADADVSVKFRSSTAGDLTGPMAAGARGGGGGASFSPAGHFETAVGEALQLNLSGAVQVSGHLTYIEV